MSRINTRELAAGMRLAEDVIGSNGRLLIVKDTVLGAKHLRVLNIWGVSEVEIAAEVGQAPAARAPADAQTLAACRDYVAAMFGGVPGQGEFKGELFRLTVRWYAARVEDGLPLPLPPARPPAAQPGPGPKSMAAMLAKGGRMIACPEAYLRIMEALKNPNCSVAALADIVGKDIAITSRLLRLVNSPIYGYSMKIDSLVRGVTILGFKELSQLVLGLSVFKSFEGVRSEVLSVREFLKHGLSCGVLARILASHRPGLPEERFFVAGLLHDIGRMSMLVAMPSNLAAAMARAADGSVSLQQAEEELFGFDHAQAGGALLAQWKLPPELDDPIRWHHDPARADDPVAASILSVADCLATAMRFGFSGSLHLTVLEDDAWERLGLPLGVLESVMAQAQRQVDEALRAFAD